MKNCKTSLSLSCRAKRALKLESYTGENVSIQFCIWNYLIKLSGIYINTISLGLLFYNRLDDSLQKAH